MRTELPNVLCEVEMKYKSGKAPLMKETAKIKTSKDASELLRNYYEAEGLLIDQQEYFVIMHLRKNNTVKGMQTVSIGGQSSCTVDPKIIFKSALLMGSASIIVCHNHPSGENKPSDQDKAITNKLKEAGKFLEIGVLDHVILMPSDTYFSFADEGMM